jgi:trehalose 6-phosphate phosphatase
VAAVHGLAFFQGRMVFELRPPVQIDKGTTLLRLVMEHQLEAVVFLGDDTTDAHALAMTRELREKHVCYALGLGVESDAMPDSVLASADLMVSGVADVEAFLDWLLNARRASSSCD